MSFKKSNFLLKSILLVSLLFTSTQSSLAYTQVELEKRSLFYKSIIEKRVGSKLDKISDEKLYNVLGSIDNLMNKYAKDNELSDQKKLHKIAILHSFKVIIMERFNPDLSDVNTILWNNESNIKKTEIIIITDKRCWEKCDTRELIVNLKKASWLEHSEFIEYDFSEKKGKEILKKSWIKYLPVVLFEDNNIWELSKFLEKTQTGELYSLDIGSTYDPTVKRSAKGFKLLDKKIINTIKKESYIKGNKNAKILWLEYSDMECPYCAKLHNDGTVKKIEKKYGTKLAYSLQHFPLGFHKNSLSAATYLECIWKIKWTTAFYELEDIIFSKKTSDTTFIVSEAKKIGVNLTTLNKCVQDKNILKKISAQENQGRTLFWIQGTPWNVLINTQTGEYAIISGAYPADHFIETIDRLLK